MSGWIVVLVFVGGGVDAEFRSDGSAIGREALGIDPIAGTVLVGGPGGDEPLLIAVGSSGADPGDVGLGKRPEVEGTGSAVEIGCGSKADQDVCSEQESCGAVNGEVGGEGSPGASAIEAVLPAAL